MRSLQFITDRKNWKSNILMGAVCLLIPAIGQIVFSGYLFEVIEALQRDPDHVDYPDFDFNRFMEYLMRGIWPFLMSLVVGLIIAVPIMLVAFVIMGLGIAIGASTNTPALVVVAYLLTTVVAIVIGLLSVLVTFPAELQAGLGREFNLSRMWAFVKDFNKRVMKETLISVLFLFVMALVAEFVGFLMCCVGIPFTFAAVIMARHHLLFQLYMLHLERGGAPIIVAGSTSRSEELPKESSRYDERTESDEPDDRFRAE